MNNKKFLVWYDLLLEDYFAIEKEAVEPNFLQQLKNENVKIFEVMANGIKEALNKQFPKEQRNTKHCAIH